MKDFNAAPYLPQFPKGATRESQIRAIVEKLNREIRYTGLEFAEGSVVPRKPSEVIEHKYGDCKDTAALAVALLRAAGIEAHVALLLSSYGRDIEPDLPGMDVFSHAIVYAPGSPDYWLDLTDSGLRLGVVSESNQGRYALIASPKTTALLRTPEMTATDNRVVETREFILSELGRAKVTETSEVYGTADREYRESFRDRDQEKLRKSLERYVGESYGEAKIAGVSTGDAADLNKPFMLKITLDDAQRGTTGRTEAAVAIFPAQITGRLPAYFREEPKNDEEKAKDAARKQDFVIHDPFSYEWRYRIVSPPGFRIRQLPEEKQEKLGPATLEVSFARQSDTEVSGVLRFTLAQRRLTADEGHALRTAVKELGQRKATLIYFDQIGETDLESGNVKGALAEFQRLLALHPKEALHRLQYARALLEAGAGESARAEARKAVALEPDSASAYVQLAEILKFDLVGRSLAKGFDRDGAVEAYRRALELKPDDAASRANLAILLEHNPSGVRYAPASRMSEAIDEYKKILDKVAGLGLPQNYPIALLMAGRTEEARAYLAKQPDSEINQVSLVSTEAILRSSKAAIEKAGEVSGVAARQRVLSSAGQTLLSLRHYELAADLIEAVAAGSGNPPALTNLVQVLRRTKKLEDQPVTVATPEDAARLFFLRAAAFENHKNDWMETISPLLRDDPTMQVGAIQAGLVGKTQNSALTAEVTLDLGLSAMQFSHTGTEEYGYVVRVNAPGLPNEMAGRSILVNKEPEGYRIVAFYGAYRGAARLALSLAEQGKADQARVWLDRVRQEVPIGSGDDPISGALFSRLWQEGSSTADASAVRRAAAALLIAEDTAAVTLPILEDARAKADPSLQNVVSAALGEVYFGAKQYSKALAIAEELMKALPQSPTALRLALRSAYALGGREQAERVIKANLDRFAQNIPALRMMGAVALTFGDTERSSAMGREIIAAGRATASDYNQVAWGDLVGGKVTAESLDFGNKGLLESNNSPGIMHTLAAVEAEAGKLAEARAMILQRLKTQNSVEPDENDWYVFGRIAEQYGLTTEASVMYRRLSKPKNELAIPSSSYALAQRRLVLLEPGSAKVPAR